MNNLIYHLVPVDYWEAQPIEQSYVPVDYVREGFIHCTKGADQMVIVANRYYRNDPRVWLVLVLDEQAITSEIKYELGGDGQFYPHIYGPLNRDAIREAKRMPRNVDGTFSSFAHS